MSMMKRPCLNREKVPGLRSGYLVDQLSKRLFVFILYTIQNPGPFLVLGSEPVPAFRNYNLKVHTFSLLSILTDGNAGDGQDLAG
jgi:hypothetical protein